MIINYFFKGEKSKTLIYLREDALNEIRGSQLATWKNDRLLLPQQARNIK